MSLAYKSKPNNTIVFPIFIGESQNVSHENLFEDIEIKNIIRYGKYLYKHTLYF